MTKNKMEIDPARQLAIDTNTAQNQVKLKSKIVNGDFTSEDVLGLLNKLHKNNTANQFKIVDVPGKNFMDEDVLNTGIQMSVELTKKEAQLIALAKRFAVPPPAWSENPTEELKNAGVTPFQAELTVGRNSDGKYMMNVKSTGDYLSEIMSRPEFVSPPDSMIEENARYRVMFAVTRYLACAGVFKFDPSALIQPKNDMVDVSQINDPVEGLLLTKDVFLTDPAGKINQFIRQNITSADSRDTLVRDFQDCIGRDTLSLHDRIEINREKLGYKPTQEDGLSTPEPARIKRAEPEQERPRRKFG